MKEMSIPERVDLTNQIIGLCNSIGIILSGYHGTIWSWGRQYKINVESADRFQIFKPNDKNEDRLLFVIETIFYKDEDGDEDKLTWTVSRYYDEIIPVTFPIGSEVLTDYSDVIINDLQFLYMSIRGGIAY